MKGLCPVCRRYYSLTSDIRRDEAVIDECEAKMADAALEFLSELPAEEREARITAFEKATASLPSNPRIAAHSRYTRPCRGSGLVPKRVIE